MMHVENTEGFTKPEDRWTAMITVPYKPWKAHTVVFHEYLTLGTSAVGPLCRPTLILPGRNLENSIQFNS